MRIRTIEFDWEISPILEEEAREKEYQERMRKKEAEECRGRYEEMRRILERYDQPHESLEPVSAALQMVSPFALDA